MGDEVQYGATGFLLGNLRDDASIGKEKHYRVYLATNRHVLEGKTSGLLRFNTFGFPMGQVGKERNYTIVRHGSLARVRDAIVGSSESFLVDTLIFPGNSGGPVVIRPEALAVGGTKATQKALLIGIVAGYLPYRDVAVSQQTKRARVIFEENSGLAVVSRLTACYRLPTWLRRALGLIRFRGHILKGGYDVHDGATNQELQRPRVFLDT